MSARMRVRAAGVSVCLYRGAVCFFDYRKRKDEKIEGECVV
jgi:hypothetical protein